MTSLSALIDRLAQATEGSRELDKAFADCVFDLEWRPYQSNARKLWAYKKGTNTVRFYGIESIPGYTRSIDAALRIAKDADQRRQFLYHAADTCFHAKLDPAQHAPRLICLASLRAIDSGRTE